MKRVSARAGFMQLHRHRVDGKITCFQVVFQRFSLKPGKVYHVALPVQFQQNPVDTPLIIQREELAVQRVGGPAGIVTGILWKDQVNIVARLSSQLITNNPANKPGAGSRINHLAQFAQKRSRCISDR